MAQSERLANDDQLARELYSALCNMQWRLKEDKEDVFSYSWRGAGGLVADMRAIGENYMDFYCTGGEGLVTQQILTIMNDAGFVPEAWEDGNVVVVPTIDYEKHWADCREGWEHTLEWLEELQEKKKEKKE